MSCGGDDTVVANGSTICTRCGSVLDENNSIVSEVTFGETGGGAAMVQGSYVGLDQGISPFCCFLAEADATTQREHGRRLGIARREGKSRESRRSRMVRAPFSRVKLPAHLLAAQGGNGFKNLLTHSG